MVRPFGWDPVAVESDPAVLAAAFSESEVRLPLLS